MRIGEVEGEFTKWDTLVFGPASVSLPGADYKGAARNAQEPASPGALQIAGSLGPVRPGNRPRDWQYRLAVSGETQRVQDLIALAGAFGRPANAEWSVQGPVALARLERCAAPRNLGNQRNAGLARLPVPSVVLNQPLLVGAATVTIKGASARFVSARCRRSARIGPARCIGARRSLWDFDLSADRLDAAELDRWLGPGASRACSIASCPLRRPAASAPVHDAVFARLAARGRLRVGEVLLSSLACRKARCRRGNRRPQLVLRRAQADFYGGRVSGELRCVSRPPSRRTCFADGSIV